MLFLFFLLLLRIFCRSKHTHAQTHTHTHTHFCIQWKVLLKRTTFDAKLATTITLVMVLYAPEVSHLKKNGGAPFVRAIFSPAFVHFLYKQACQHTRPHTLTHTHIHLRSHTHACIEIICYKIEKSCYWCSRVEQSL